MSLEIMHVGLDLSLTSTGLAKLVPGEEPVTRAVKSKPTGSTLRARYDRILNIVEQIRDFGLGEHDGHAPLQPTDPIPPWIRWYVEAPTYATHTGSQHDRSGLWWDAVQMCMAYGEVVEVSPTTLKAFATGKGNADKTLMTVTAAREFPGVPLATDDEVDALWLAVLSEYVGNPDTGRVARTAYRDKAASAVPKH